MVFHFAAATMVGRPQGRRWVQGERTCAAAFLALISMVAWSPSTAQTPPQFTVAFIGDQGLTTASRNVLHLIAAEGADAVLHSGDFDYDDDPQAWNAQIDSILGVDFPYFASIGNHDEPRDYGAGGYQQFIAARMNRLGIPWTGDLGVQSSFVYQGVDFVLTAPGIAGSGHDTYIRDHFATSTHIWRVSSHHKVMHLMQPEGKAARRLNGRIQPGGFVTLVRIPMKADTCSNPYRTAFRACRTVVESRHRGQKAQGRRRGHPLGRVSTRKIVFVPNFSFLFS